MHSISPCIELTSHHWEKKVRNFASCIHILNLLNYWFFTGHETVDMLLLGCGWYPYLNLKVNPIHWFQIRCTILTVFSYRQNKLIGSYNLYAKNTDVFNTQMLLILLRNSKLLLPLLSVLTSANRKERRCHLPLLFSPLLELVHC